MRPEDLVGKNVTNRYRVRRLIGEGGMGFVYEAEDTRLGRHVALKVLSPDLAAAPRNLTRFQREARAAAAIGHPGIIEVLDFGTLDSGLPFFAMELLHGRSLGQELEAEHRIAVPRAIDIAGQVLDALAAAHRAGIVHRDIKPDNIFLCPRLDDSWLRRQPGVLPREQVKVLDFGIVLVNDPAGAQEPSQPPRRPHMKLTKPGTFLGTAWYVSPEQARADPTVGPATDIWAVGAILYEMLAGVPPFDGAVDVEVLYKVLQIRHVPLAEAVAGTPRGLSEVADRALEKRASDRYPDAAAFIEALRPFAEARASAAVLAGTPGVGAPPRVVRRFRAPELAPTVVAPGPDVGRSDDSAGASVTSGPMRAVRRATGVDGLAATVEASALSFVDDRIETPAMTAPTPASAAADRDAVPVPPGLSGSRPTDHGDTGQLAVHATTTHTSQPRRAVVLGAIVLVALVLAVVVIRNATRNSGPPSHAGASRPADPAELLGPPDVVQGGRPSPSSAGGAESEDASTGAEPDPAGPDEEPDGEAGTIGDQPPEAEAAATDVATVDWTSGGDDAGVRDVHRRDDSRDIRDAGAVLPDGDREVTPGTGPDGPSTPSADRTATADSTDPGRTERDGTADAFEGTPPDTATPADPGATVDAVDAGAPSVPDASSAGMLVGPDGMLIRPTRRDAGR
ncbi:MAG: protein kinase [Deltaproteobacteria bacterium]|nr:protein kinase [Deltaproteobacteria bacterium]